MKDMLDKAGSTETEKMLSSLRGGTFKTIVGDVVMRAIDQQSSMGAWVGETTKQGKVGTMKNWTYEDGSKFMFSEAEVKAARKE
jgi:branched-chain amino acid transport system substrate-binding protein